MGNMRSPNYPAIGLHDSIQRVRSLWAKEKRTPVPPDVAAKAIGYSSLSGPSRTAIGALRQYGLVDRDDRNVRVSDLALRILHSPDQDEELKALQEAALKPDLFAQLFNTHASASDDAIRSYLITKLDFSESGARQVAKTFKETISLARLNATDYNTQDTQEGESVQNQQNNTVTSRTTPQQSGQLAASSSNQTLTSSYSFSWPLSGDVKAEVKITGGELKPEYFDALRQYIAIAEKLIAQPFKEGDAVEYPDAYTGEIKYGRIDRMYGGDAIIRTITKEEAGPNPKKFSPKPAPTKAQ